MARASRRARCCAARGGAQQVQLSCARRGSLFSVQVESSEWLEQVGRLMACQKLSCTTVCTAPWQAEQQAGMCDVCKAENRPVRGHSRRPDTDSPLATSHLFAQQGSLLAAQHGAICSSAGWQPRDQCLVRLARWGHAGGARCSGHAAAAWCTLLMQLRARSSSSRSRSITKPVAAAAARLALTGCDAAAHRAAAAGRRRRPRCSLGRRRRRRSSASARSQTPILMNACCLRSSWSSQHTCSRLVASCQLLDVLVGREGRHVPAAMRSGRRHSSTQNAAMDSRH